MLKLFVDCAKLPFPSDVVEEGTMIEAIVIGTVEFGVVAGREHGHFVPVDGITAEKMFHFFGHFVGSVRGCPSGSKFTKHRVRTAVVLFTESSEQAELVVGHT